MSKYPTYRDRTGDGTPLEGPTDIEAGLLICHCGYATDWEDAKAHRASRDHALRLIEWYRAHGWQSFLDDIESGLGWAANEGAGGDEDPADIMAVLRELTRSEAAA